MTPVIRSLTKLARVLVCLIAAVLISGCAMLRTQPVEPTSLACHYTSRPIQVDGMIEPAWQQAAVVSPFIVPGTHVPAQSPTEARLLWDDTYLYVLFAAKDRDVWAYADERDDITCRDDVLEVFVKPDAHGEGYANFEINVLETIYDAYAPRENTPMGRRWKQWNCEGLLVATAVKGTLNDYADEDESWVMEVAIPFASLPPCRGHAPVPGSQWRILLARYDYSIYLDKGVELSTCFPLTKPNFHVTEEWGLVTFLGVAGVDSE